MVAGDKGLVMKSMGLDLHSADKGEMARVRWHWGDVVGGKALRGLRDGVRSEVEACLITSFWESDGHWDGNHREMNPSPQLQQAMWVRLQGPSGDPQTQRAIRFLSHPEFFLPHCGSKEGQMLYHWATSLPCGFSHSLIAVGKYMIKTTKAERVSLVS